MHARCPFAVAHAAAAALLLASCTASLPPAPAPSMQATAPAPPAAARHEVDKPATVPQSAAGAPSVPSPPSKPPPPTPPATVPATKARPAPAPVTPAPAARPPAPAVPVAAAPPPAPPPLDLKSLEERLKGTDAIGVLTKLSLKNQVDDLIGRFRAFHAGQRPPTLGELKPAFELLLMKVLSLLQDKDAALARDIDRSRDGLWGVLVDRDKLSRYASR